jgi:hypothetical protein
MVEADVFDNPANLEICYCHTPRAAMMVTSPCKRCGSDSAAMRYDGPLKPHSPEDGDKGDCRNEKQLYPKSTNLIS